MTNQEKQKLNEKLARWAGFKYHDSIWYAPDHIPSADSNFYYSHNLPFTDSPDACFKWLVPKVVEKYKVAIFSEKKGYAVYFFRDSDECSKAAAFSETPALAFCLAIEKLIDKENA